MIIRLKEIDESIISRLNNSIFIYPTDTIYGIGCNAENKELVNKIREIKGRDNKPFSIIAPSINWIKENCIVDINLNLEKYLPGKYTLILKKRNSDFLSHVSDTEFLGIRIPKHKFTKILQKLKKPIITTSVNLSGNPPANKIEEISKLILNKVDLIIDAGTLSGKPSTLIKDGKVIER